VSIATRISTSIVPVVSATGLGVLALGWVRKTVKEDLYALLPILHIFILSVMDSSEARRLLVAYTVDLIKVLIELFDRTIKVEFKTNWPELEAAFEAYESSSSRKSIHESIRSKKRGVTDDISREIRQLLEVD
jgi:hypothetical protein